MEDINASGALRVMAGGFYYLIFGGILLLTDKWWCKCSRRYSAPW
jgi:hypothetical protein